MINRDYARAWLPHDLAPGAQAAVQIEVPAPPTPGRYALKFDLVSEGMFPPPPSPLPPVPHPPCLPPRCPPARRPVQIAVRSRSAPGATAAEVATW